MNKNMKHIITAVLSITAAAYCIPSLGQSMGASASQDQATSQMESKADQADQAYKAPQSNGEIRKIDIETGKVTIKHGEIKNLDMPGMTMVFQATPKGLLEGLKVGDKVLFHAEKIGGSIAVTALKPAR